MTVVMAVAGNLLLADFAGSDQLRHRVSERTEDRAPIGRSSMLETMSVRILWPPPPPLHTALALCAALSCCYLFRHVLEGRPFPAFAHLALLRLPGEPVISWRHVSVVALVRFGFLAVRAMAAIFPRLVPVLTLGR